MGIENFPTFPSPRNDTVIVEMFFRWSGVGVIFLPLFFARSWANLFLCGNNAEVYLYAVIVKLPKLYLNMMKRIVDVEKTSLLTTLW